MKVYIFIIFMVIHTITAEKALSKLRRKLIVPKTDDKCKKIKCASVDEPECVRMKRNDLGFHVHIIVVNKCELHYLQCHDNVEAKIVPMKFCSHTQRLSGKKIIKDKSRLRVKRSVLRQNEKEDKEAPIKGVEKLQMKQLKTSNKTKIMAKKSVTWKNETSNFIIKDTDEKMTESERAHRQGISYTSAELGDDPERKDIYNGDAGHRVQGYDFTLGESVKDIAGMPFKLNKPQRKTKKSELPDFPMLSNEADNFEGMVQQADLKQYEADCPTVCPSRDVLVCARCQHGIFKTFMSVCHMRMFTCQHKDEVLQLISRSPCLLSAPYLSEDGMEPHGRVVEAGDDDKVMRYILCRDNNRMEDNGKTGDPRCNFPSLVTTSKYFYDYKGVNRPLDSLLLVNSFPTAKQAKPGLYQN